MPTKHMTPQDQLKQLMATLQKNADANARARQEADRNTYLTQMGRFFGAALQPLKEAVAEMKRIGGSLGILSSRLNSLEIPTPEVNVDLSSIRIPTPNVTVKPIVDISNIKMPDEMSVKGWIGLMGYDRGLLTNPLPVQLRDASGKPVDLSGGLTQIIGGGGGGGGNHVLVDNLSDISITSSGSSSISLVNSDGAYYNSDNPLPITGSISTSPGATFYASDAIGSVNLIQVGGNSVVVGTGYQDNALRVVHATDAIASVNVASVASSIPVLQVSGAIDSVSIVSNIAALDVIQVSGAIDSVSIVSNIAALDVKQVSGSIDSVNVSQVNGSAVVVGTGYQDNAIRVVHATDAIASVNIVSSATLTVTGSLTSSVIVGPTVADTADDGNAPVQVGGVARTANPTAVAGNDIVKATFDDVGRQLIRPVQVRDLMQTARATLTNGSETTLLAGSSGVFNDLVYIMGANNSDAAVSVDVRAATGGGVQFTLQIPASGTAGVSLPVPIPQDVAADTWTADMSDITGTTVSISALFSKEV